MYTIDELRDVINTRTGYYTYILYKPAQEKGLYTPFYVGEGQKNRVRDHFKPSDTHNIYKKRVIIKYWDDIRIEINFCDNKTDAKELQDFLILEIGIKNLTNAMGPVDDLGGVDKHSEETKAKLRLSGLGKKQSEETKIKRGIYKKGEYSFSYGKKHSQETKDKISKNRIGKCAGKENGFYNKKHSEATREIMSKNGKGKNPGSTNSNSKLTEVDVQGIKYLMYFKQFSSINLGLLFGVHKDTINNIKQEHTWKHVTI